MRLFQDEFFKTLRTRVVTKLKSSSQLMGRERHVCLIFSDSSVCEHQLIIAKCLREMHFDYCLINFKGLAPAPTEIPILWIRSKLHLKFHLAMRNSCFIFLQTPYMEHYPNWLLSFHRKFAYAGYGLPMTDWEEGHFGQEFVKKSTLLIAGSSYEFQGYKEIINSEADVVFSGNPMMWKLRQELTKQNVDFDQGLQLLWAPHWSPSWFNSNRGFSRWKECLHPILEFSRTNPNVKVLIRPHPILSLALESQKARNASLLDHEVFSVQSEEYFEENLRFYNELLRLKNVSVSQNNLISDVLNSDFLLTEGLSIIGYWASTGKPIAVYRDQDSPTFSGIGESLLKEVEVLNSSDSVVNWLSSLNAQKSKLKNERLMELSEVLFPTFEESPLFIALKQWSSRV
jgi:hypothetical protein